MSPGSASFDRGPAGVSDSSPHEPTAGRAPLVLALLRPAHSLLTRRPIDRPSHIPIVEGLQGQTRGLGPGLGVGRIVQGRTPRHGRRAPFSAHGPRKDGPRYFSLEIDIKDLYFCFGVPYLCSCQGDGALTKTQRSKDHVCTYQHLPRRPIQLRYRY